MSPDRTRLVLWRHGQTDWNVSNRFQGQADEPLNEVGRAQAAQAVEELVHFGVDVIVSSPLIRARATGQVLAQRLGLPMSFDDRLMEISVGSWEGRGVDEVIAAEPGFWQALAQGRDVRRSATGETATEAGERMAACLRDLAARYEGKTVVVASHGLVIKMSTAALLGWDYATSTGLASMMNCAFTTVVHCGGDRWKLVTWNQVAQPVSR